MSDRNEISKKKVRLLQLVMVLFALWSNPLRATELQQFLLSPLVDPFATKPKLLEQGPALQDDIASPPCATPNQMSEVRMSLSEAVDFALCNNAKIRATWAGIKERSAALGSSEAAFFPTVSLTVGRQRTDSGYPDTSIPANPVRGNTVNGSLNWRLFDFGAREEDRQKANNLLLAAIDNHNATVQQIMADTVQAYFDTQSAQAVLNGMTEDASIAKATMKSVERREAAGASSDNDALQADTAVARANLNVSRAAGDYSKALAILAYVIGLPPDCKIETSRDDDLNVRQAPNELYPLSDELDQWLQAAGRTHPEILAADAQWQAARNAVKAARATGLPTVDFSANYYRNGYPNQGLSINNSRVGNIGVFVSIPIFSGFAQTYQVRQSEAVAEQRRADLDDTRRRVLMDVVKGYSDARAALYNLHSSKTLLSVAKKSLASSQRRYNKGAVDIVEVLNAQKALTDAKLENIRSIADWRAARLHLMTSAGLLERAELAAPTGGHELSVPSKILSQ